MIGDSQGGWSIAPLLIASGKTKHNLRIGFRGLDASDAVSIGNLTITPSNGTKLTIANEAIATTAQVIGGETFAIGHSASYSLTAATIASESESYTLEVDWESDDGEGSIDEIRVDIRPTLEAKYETQQEVLTAALVSAPAADLFISAEALGVVSNSTAARSANTSAILDYYAAKYAAEATAGVVYPPIKWPAGTINLGGKLDIESRAYKAAFSNTKWEGAGSAFATQHLETGGGQELYQTIIDIDMDADTDIWWYQAGSTTDGVRPGIIEFKDITFRIFDKGSLFQIGDPTVSVEGISDQPLSRGVIFEGCYFTDPTHVTNTGAGATQTFLYDNSVASGVANDLRIQKLRTNYAIDVVRGYDVSINRCGFRGFGSHHVGLRNCDHATVTHTHHTQCPIFIINMPRNGSGLLADSNDGVPGIFHDNYGEVALITGFVGGGKWQDPECEVGYNSQTGDVKCGPRNLPTGATWSVTAGADHIVLANLPSGADATDYVVVGQVISIADPDVDYERSHLIVTKVSGNNIYFNNPQASGFYGGNTFAADRDGEATDFRRYFGVPAAIGGMRSTLGDYRANINEQYMDRIGGVVGGAQADMPTLALWPSRSSMRVGMEFGGQGFSGINDYQRPVVCHRCAGDSSFMDALVLWHGSGQYPLHPDVVLPFGHVQKEQRSKRLPVLNRLEAETAKYDVFCRPGRGILGYDGSGRKLVYKTLTDPDYGECNAYYQPEGKWYLGLPITDPIPMILYVRVYNPGTTLTSTGSLYVAKRTFVSGDTFEFHDVPAGWSTIRVPITSVVPDPGGQGVHLVENAARTFYVAWVGVDYAPFMPIETSTAGAPPSDKTGYYLPGMWGYHTDTGGNYYNVRNVAGVLKKTALT